MKLISRLIPNQKKTISNPSKPPEKSHRPQSAISKSAIRYNRSKIQFLQGNIFVWYVKRVRPQPLNSLSVRQLCRPSRSPFWIGNPRILFGTCTGMQSYLRVYMRIWKTRCFQYRRITWIPLGKLEMRVLCSVDRWSIHFSIHFLGVPDFLESITWNKLDEVGFHE